MGGCQEGRRRGVVPAFERRRPSIVLADDEPDVRERLVRLLTDSYDVLAVANGHDLVESVFDLHPDALVTDLSMPVLSGLDALEQLNQRRAAVPAAIVSVHSSRAYVRRALDLGASAYVLKASAVEDLPLALRSVLAGATFLSLGIEMLDAPTTGRNTFL